MPEKNCRTAGFLILIMFATPGMVQSESVFIDRPGKEFSSTSRLPQAQPSHDGYDVAGQTGRAETRFQMQNRSASQSAYPQRNRRNSAHQDNPWKPGGRVYTNPQHKSRPWGSVPADAPALTSPMEQQQRDYGRTNESVPYYQPNYYRYQPAPMRPYSAPGYGGYANGLSSPYGNGYMPGYGGRGNQFFPFGSFGGMPGSGMSGGMFPGMPGGMFW